MATRNVRGANAPRPEARILLEFDKMTDFKDFLVTCLQNPSNAKPYINEDKNTGYMGLIGKYDEITLKQIQEANASIHRAVGPDRAALQEVIERIAIRTECNIIAWNSEGNQCVWDRAEFINAVKDSIRTIENDFPTVVFMIACTTGSHAAKLNRAQLGIWNLNTPAPPRFFPNSPVYRSQAEIWFLGFNGQVHSYKEHIFVCAESYLRDDFPIRICPTDRANNGSNDQLAQSIQMGINPNTGDEINVEEVLRRNNSESSERLKCCKKMIDDFPRHFLKAFKGHRNCIKVTPENIIERIDNLKSKTARTFQDDDSTIRVYNDGGVYDGIYCKSTAANPDPCEIGDTDLIVNAATRNAVNRYQRVYRNEAGNEMPLVKWYKLLERLIDRQRVITFSKFMRIFNDFLNIPGIRIEDYINTTNKFGQHCLMILLESTATINIDDRLNILKKLIEYGASLNHIKIEKPDPLNPYQRIGPHENTSICSMILNDYLDVKNPKIKIGEYFLWKTPIDVGTDPVMLAKRAFANRASTSPADKQRMAELDNKFKNYLDELLNKNLNFLKDARVGALEEKVCAIIDLFRKLGAIHTVDFLPLILKKDLPKSLKIRAKIIPAETYKNPQDRPIENDVAIFNILRRPAEEGRTEYDKIKLAIESIRDRGSQDIFPLTENIIGMRQGCSPAVRAPPAPVAAVQNGQETYEQRIIRLRAEAAARRAAAVAQNAPAPVAGNTAGGARRRNRRATRKGKSNGRRNRKSKTRKH